MSNRSIECRRHVELEVTLRLALDFVEDVYLGEWRGPTERQEEVISAIKEALAQPAAVVEPHIAEQHKQRSVSEHLEPVAWGNFKEDGTLVGLSQHPEDQSNWTGRKPLYTTPPQRKPLTDTVTTAMKQAGLAASADTQLDPTWEELEIIYKAMNKAAHGIKE